MLYFILFNIAFDGTVQFQFPLKGDTVPLTGANFNLPLKVQKPFGADHVVAIVSDERLTRRAVGGDERAFAAIFSRYHQSLYRFCLARLDRAQGRIEELARAATEERAQREPA